MARVEYKEDGTPYLSDDWYIADVETVCERMGVTLTADEMETVLHDVAHGFDATYGISWDSFEWAIESIVRDKDNGNS